MASTSGCAAGGRARQNFMNITVPQGGARAHQPGQAHGQELQLRLRHALQLASNLRGGSESGAGTRTNASALQRRSAGAARRRCSGTRTCTAVSGTVSIMTPPATTHTAARAHVSGQG